MIAFLFCQGIPKFDCFIKFLIRNLQCIQTLPVLSNRFGTFRLWIFCVFPFCEFCFCLFLFQTFLLILFFFFLHLQFQRVFIRKPDICYRFPHLRKIRSFFKILCISATVFQLFRIKNKLCIRSVPCI